MNIARIYQVKPIPTILIFFFCFIFFDSTLIIAQSDVTQTTTRAGEERFQAKNFWERKTYAVENIKSLREGTLIVRLITYNEKIKILNEKGYTKKAQTLQEQANIINSWFVNEFYKNYDFSDVVFCYGLDLKEFLNGEKQDIFLDQNLELDQNIKVKDGPIYLLAAQASDRYYLYNKQFERIPEPAPHAINYEIGKVKTGYPGSLDRFFELFSGIRLRNTSVTYFNEKLYSLYKAR